MSWLTALGVGSETYDQDESHVCGYNVVSGRRENIGTIQDYVLDGTDKLRYFVVQVGSWMDGKKVTVPVGMA